MRQFPGARWWKFDFHAHTPASKDTAWHRVEGTADEVTPEKWLLKYMAAEVDCVAVTDHNTGAWVDKLKAAYARMKAAADEGGEPSGFRTLAIFPGVQISVQGGVHILAILAPAATTSDVDTLVGGVKYRGTPGDSDGVTTVGIAEVLREILDTDALPVPAHADAKKGLLECSAGTRESKVDPITLRQAMAVDGLLAVEWLDQTALAPQVVEKEALRLARVLGSDCHNFQGPDVPGSRYTWVKMAEPTLEALRLALLDGNHVSLRRSDEGAFDPDRVPDHAIGAIEIENARFMGNGGLARVEFSPFFNGIVGGRGTGKSTLVHALRLAARRESELLQGTEARDQFDAFSKTAKGRTGDGALRESTVVRVEWWREGSQLRLVWRADGSGGSVEEWNEGAWEASRSQALSAARFPLRVFSQGQIAALAGDGRRTLLSIIDESAGVEPLKAAFEEARRAFFVQRARLRELDAKLAGLPEVDRELGELSRKLEALSSTDHASVLQAFALANMQQREVETLFEQARQAAERIASMAEDIVLDDWAPQHFEGHDEDVLSWRAAADAEVAAVRGTVEGQGRTLREGLERWKKDDRYKSWQARVEGAMQAHRALQEQLAAQGVEDPQAFERMTRERQILEQKKRELDRVRGDRDALVELLEAQRHLLASRRADITKARGAFLEKVLVNSSHVKITVVEQGFDARQVERELRDLLEANDERFATDILSSEEGEEDVGLAAELAMADETRKSDTVAEVKRRLCEVAEDLKGHFRNYLTKKHERPEFTDRIQAWFPEDDLKIQYQRDNQWTSIGQGSQGQRSAALLAFLLAFGTEPLVLDQPEDDLDNHLIYDLIVTQIRENKLRRQLIIVTHNANVVVNGDAELVHVMEFGHGQCFVKQSGALQEQALRQEVCRVMEGGREAFSRRWKRLGSGS
jgi:energy-coupling factor transporter ATP-binding protein EcfA2